jgi:hypothetical protein
METITLPPFEDLTKLYKLNGFHLRFGQWFVNNYIKDCKECFWLFYEIDDAKSLLMIKNIFYK